MYWNSIFRGRLRSLFGVDNYGLYRAFAGNPYQTIDSLGLKHSDLFKSVYSIVLDTKLFIRQRLFDLERSSFAREKCGKKLLRAMWKLLDEVHWEILVLHRKNKTDRLSTRHQIEMIFPNLVHSPAFMHKNHTFVNENQGGTYYPPQDIMGDEYVYIRFEDFFPAVRPKGEPKENEDDIETALGTYRYNPYEILYTLANETVHYINKNSQRVEVNGELKISEEEELDSSYAEARLRLFFEPDKELSIESCKGRASNPQYQPIIDNTEPILKKLKEQGSLDKQN